MKRVLIAVLSITSSSVFASNAELALEYCKEAVGIEISRNERLAGLGIESFCSSADRTAESWKCILHSMKVNEYSMTQAISDCDNGM